ncbi:MAG: family 16 glycosylhydrolase [Spirochaetales bacterium]|nr:family 16 glycosylhydrolase [Spirochaetales bacterium]
MKNLMPFTAFAAIIILSCSIMNTPGDPSPTTIPPGSLEAPGAPLLAAGNASISLSWNSVSEATFYEVWYGFANDCSRAVKYSADFSVTNATINGLTNGAVYYFWIRAGNDTAKSPFSPSSYAIPNAGSGGNDDWTLAWSDEFDGTVLDPDTWTYDIGAGGWGNNESQYYKAENAVVAGGYLTITAKIEAAGDAPYTSARIQTSQKKVFQYGRLEIRAKLPATQGMWPAFWLLGENCDSFGLYGGDVTWPACGEIDAMEMIGGLADGSGDFTAHGTLHYIDATGRNPAPSCAFRNETRLCEAFHTFGMEWTPQSFTWTIDGLAYGTRLMEADMDEFHKPFFLLLNLAIGGPWGGWADESTVFPQTFVIDYVRHYTKPYAPAGTQPGLPSIWHMTDQGRLEAQAGTISGAQPIVTLSDDALSWNTPYMTGSIDPGAWAVGIWTYPVASASSVQARLYRGSSASEVMMAETAADPSKTGNGNHITWFTFTGIPTIDLTDESIRVELTRISGPDLTLIVNGNDFDSRLTIPWSPTGEVSEEYPDSTPAPTSTPWPDDTQGPTATPTQTIAPSSLSVYSETAMATAWPGIVGPNVYNGGSASETSDQAREGNKSVYVELTGDRSGAHWAGAPHDISAYGNLHFWIKVDLPGPDVNIKLAATGPVCIVSLDSRLQAGSDWQEIVVPVSELISGGLSDPANTTVPFGLELGAGGTAFRAWVDHVWFSAE